MRLSGCGPFVVVLTAASVSIPAQAALPPAPEVRALASVMLQAVNWSRFSFCWGTFRYKRTKNISAVRNDFKER